MRFFGFFFLAVLADSVSTAFPPIEPTYLTLDLAPIIAELTCAPFRNVIACGAPNNPCPAILWSHVQVGSLFRATLFNWGFNNEVCSEGWCRSHEGTVWMRAVSNSGPELTISTSETAVTHLCPAPCAASDGVTFSGICQMQVGLCQYGLAEYKNACDGSLSIQPEFGRQTPLLCYDNDTSGCGMTAEEPCPATGAYGVHELGDVVLLSREQRAADDDDLCGRDQRRLEQACPSFASKHYVQVISLDGEMHMDTFSFRQLCRFGCRGPKGGFSDVCILDRRICVYGFMNADEMCDTGDVSALSWVVDNRPISVPTESGTIVVTPTTAEIHATGTRSVTALPPFTADGGAGRLVWMVTSSSVWLLLL